MAVWREWANRLRYLRQRTRIDHDVDQEVRFHLEARMADLEASGLTPEAARQQAHAEFGPVMLSREESRAAWQVRWLEDAVADLRYALRTFRRSPGFVITAVLSLALGIGATSAIFTALDAVFWRPLPVPNPSSLAMFTMELENGRTPNDLPTPFVTQLRQSGAIGSVVTLVGDGLSFSLDDRAERIVGEAVSPDFFTALGLQPILGEGFSANVQRGNWAAETVLSYTFWQRRFNGDPNVIGRTIRLNSYPFTVVGVSPPGFVGVTRGIDDQVRVPLMADGRSLPEMRLVGGYPVHRWMDTIVRLAPGLSFAQAETIVNAQFQEFLRTTTEPQYRDMHVRRLRVTYGGNGFDDALRPFHTTLYILLILAATVLVIACVNVASLLLARATARARELAVRLSIGAGRLRLIRQMLAESVLLALLGGIVALGVANWSSGLLALFVPRGHIGIALELGVDRRVLLFTVALSLLTSIAFGLLPALQATRKDLTTALKAESAGAGGSSQGARTRRLLVMSQVAFSIVLLIAAGVFVRTLGALRPADYGADPDRVLLFTMKPQQEIYTSARKQVVAGDLLRRVAALPGVESAALAESGPLDSRQGRTQVKNADRTLEVRWDAVSPGFFTTIGLPRLAGRDFTEQDNLGGPLVAIVNRAFVRAYFGEENPIGRTVQSAQGGNRVYTVIGVVADMHYFDLHRPPDPAIWVAFQRDNDLYMPTLHVRSATTDLAGLTAAVRREFDQVDKGFPVFNIKTLGVRVDESLASERMIANISAAFGILALLLAGVGLYGILAYSVVRRRREIGIRIALGSTSRSIVGLVAHEGLLLVAIGSLAGIVIAAAGSRLLLRYLPNVSALDLPTIAACAGVMLVIAAAAVCVPAARACRVDPLIALRDQ